MAFWEQYWKVALGGVAVAAGAIAIATHTTKPLSPSIPSPSTPTRTIVPPMNATGLTSYLSNDFFVEVDKLAAYFRSRGANIDGEDLLEIFLAESDCNPKIVNSIGCAGLNQICSLKNVGWTGTIQEYLALPGEQQLHFVKKYFDNVNRYPAMVDLGALYLANFSPAFLGKPQDFVMYRAGVDKSYALNKSVDTGNKGFIEVADMAKFVHRSSAAKAKKWTELQGRLSAARSVV